MKKKNQGPEIDIDRLDKSRTWHYYLEYDYDREYDCESSGCDSEGICRCSRIIDVKVTDVHIDRIAEEICSKSHPLLAYGTNRILTHSKLNDPETWEVEVSGGYYGDEIDGARFPHDAPPYEALATLLGYKNDPVNLVKHVLQHEYAYILPELQNIKSASIEKVGVHDISIGQKEHYKRLDKKIVEQYGNYELPVGVALRVDGHLKLIDGYHRLAAAIGKEKKTVDIIVVE